MSGRGRLHRWGVGTPARVGGCHACACCCQSTQLPAAYALSAWTRLPCRTTSDNISLCKVNIVCIEYISCNVVQGVDIGKYMVMFRCYYHLESGRLGAMN